mgnify:FL=1
MKGWQYILTGVGIAFAVLIGFLIGQKHPQKLPVEPIKEKVDTLLIFDTITLTKPVFVEKIQLDSVYMPVTDTLWKHDTLYVYLEREQIQWQDSLCRVYASGINPQVDSVTHFVQETIITREISVPVKVKSRWGLGIQVGYGAGVNGKQVYLTPYVGVGISYNILSW